MPSNTFWRFLLAISTAIFGVVLVLGGVTGRTPFSGSIESTTAYIDYSVSKNVGDLSIRVSIDPPAASNQDQLVLQVKYVGLVGLLGESAADEICVERLVVLENAFDERYRAGTNYGLNNRFPACFDITNPVAIEARGLGFQITSQFPVDLDNWRQTIIATRGPITSLVGHFGVVIPESESWTTPFIHRPDSFWYPYDQVELDFTMEATYSLYRKGIKIRQQSVAPTISVDSIRSGAWDFNIVNESHQLLASSAMPQTILFGSGPAKHSRTVVEGRRPLMIRLLYPIVFFAMFALVLLLIQVEIGSFLEASAAILFGLFSIRTFLLPPDQQSRTLFDLLLALMYFAFALSVLVFLIRTLTANVQKAKPSSGAVIHTPVGIAADSQTHHDQDSVASKRGRRSTVSLSTALTTLVIVGYAVLIVRRLHDRIRPAIQKQVKVGD